MTDRLAAIVARREGLTADEAIELRGTTLSELTSHAKHLVNRRHVVDAAKRRSPDLPAYAVANIEGAYDGGGVPIDQTSGKRFAATALRDAVHNDSRTRGVLGRIGANTLADQSNAERKARIAERLAAINGIGSDNA